MATNKLKARIVEEGRILPGNVLKVDAFLNHQIDPDLLDAVADNFHAQFHAAGVTKILTVESSGIAPALFTAQKFHVPLVFARKKAPSTLADSDMLTAPVHSYTKDEDTEIRVNARYLKDDDRVLLVDDFLANGEAALGMASLCEQAGATVVGLAICIEKSFQQGRGRLEDAHIPVYAEARIETLSENGIEFRAGH